MAEYVSIPFEVDPATIEARVYDYIQTAFPDFAPRPGHVIVIQTEAFAEAISTLMQMATDVPPDIFIYLGKLFGVQHITAQAATTTITVTAIDTDGHTIPEGYAFRLPIGPEEYAAFQLAADAVIPFGTDTLSDITVVAVEEGTRSNGLSGTPEWIDFVDFIDTTTVDAPTANGLDSESIDDFMDKFATRLQLLADRVITADDAERYIATIPGVSRAKALDNYNPGDDTFDNEKMLAWAALDEAGLPVVDPLLTTITDTLADAREVNFIFNHMEPENNVVTILVTVKALPGFELAAIETAIEANLAQYLNPLNFNADTTPNSPNSWVNKDHLYYLEVANIVNNTDGVDRITALTLNAVAGDLALTGRIPLVTQPPTITATAVLP